MNVMKRNGETEELSPKKILNSIEKANACVKPVSDRLSPEQIQQIVDKVVEVCQNGTVDPIPIDDLEDHIERGTMAAGGYETAKKYITYRYEKEQTRNTTLLAEKLTAANVQNQNANVDEHSFGGRMGETASYITKKYALDHLLDSRTLHNHSNNEVYVHDLDAYAVGSHNCLSVPFDRLLAGGFDTRQGDVRPAGSINTAFQLVAVIFQLQSLQQFGGVSATHLDWTMVPYVRKSFAKHYRDGLKWVGGLSDDEVARFMDGVVVGTFSCENPSADRDTGICDPIWDSNPRVQQYAMSATTKELEQAVEGLFHNLNTLQSRSGNQLPFTSINYGTCTLPEGRMVTRAILEGSLNGIGKFHKTSIFPCGIFQCKEGVNRRPGDPNYDLFQLACRSTATRLYPNYCNCDWSVQRAAVEFDRKSKQEVLDSLDQGQMAELLRRIQENPSLAERIGVEVDGSVVVPRTVEVPSEMMSTMGCRTVNGSDINAVDSFRRNVEAVLRDGRPYDDVDSAARKDGRGNIAPTTIVLPTLAMQARKKVERQFRKAGRPVEGQEFQEAVVEGFMGLLDKKIGEARDSLLNRFDWICSQSAQSARFMYGNRTMYGYVPEEGIRSALRHGTLVIGQLGLAEALRILVGCDHSNPIGMELAMRVEELYNRRCSEFKKSTHLNFGVYYTPSENLCHTAMKKFQAKYGRIEGVSDHDYFTNSMHVPVWEKMTPFDKIDLESQLTGYSNAGCITYVELDANAKDNLSAVEDLVSYAMDHDIPYFAVNVPNDTCCECGYCDDLSDGVCPKCGSDHIQSLKRVTGYLTGDFRTAFNRGKQQETIQREKHVAVEV